MTELPPLLVGKKALAKVTPTDHTGAITQYKTGTIKAISNDPKTFAVYDGKTEAYFVVSALCPGTATGTVSWTSHLGNNYTKDFTVEVTAFEAVDIKIEWDLLP